MKDALSLDYLRGAGDVNAWCRFAVDICRMQANHYWEAPRLRVNDPALHFVMEPSVIGKAFAGTEIESPTLLGVAARVVRSIAQYANDLATSFYANSLSGFFFEHGVNATVIVSEDSWTFRRYGSMCFREGMPARP